MDNQPTYFGSQCKCGNMKVVKKAQGGKFAGKWYEACPLPREQACKSSWRLCGDPTIQQPQSRFVVNTPTYSQIQQQQQAAPQPTPTPIKPFIHPDDYVCEVDDMDDVSYQNPVKRSSAGMESPASKKPRVTEEYVQRLESLSLQLLADKITALSEKVEDLTFIKETVSDVQTRVYDILHILEKPDPKISSKPQDTAVNK